MLILIVKAADIKSAAFLRSWIMRCSRIHRL